MVKWFAPFPGMQDIQDRFLVQVKIFLSLWFLYSENMKPIRLHQRTKIQYSDACHQSGSKIEEESSQMVSLRWKMFLCPGQAQSCDLRAVEVIVMEKHCVTLSKKMHASTIHIFHDVLLVPAGWVHGS